MPKNRICIDEIPRLDSDIDCIQVTQGPRNIDVLARRKGLNFIGGRRLSHRMVFKNLERSRSDTVDHNTADSHRRMQLVIE